ncbi:MAG: hypothetical protein WCI55_16280 [Armatimonadota bacterium]
MIPLLNFWTGELPQSTRLWIGIPMILLVISGMLFGQLYQYKKDTAVKLELLDWAKSEGLEVKFAEPPKGVTQVTDVALKTLDELKCPFIGISIFDHNSPTFDVIWKLEMPETLLIRGSRCLGRGNRIRESWVICKVESHLPSGYLTLSGPWSRQENYDWKLFRNDPKGALWRAPDPDTFRTIVTLDFVKLLNSNCCLGFRCEGNYIEFFFDGEVQPNSWKELMPKVESILRSLPSESTSSLVH